uniref:Uncharacterized protein n=1 Tax=Wuchereria bancrofti TaxID=6293 RepID=A0AAF5RT76_WUCBA
MLAGSLLGALQQMSTTYKLTLNIYKERQQQQQQHPKISFKMYVCMYAVIHSVEPNPPPNTIAPGIN